MFTRLDLAWLAEVARAVHAAQSIDEFTLAAGDAVDRRFSLLASACEEVGPAASLYIPHRLRLGVAPPADHAAYFHDNPFNPLTADGRDYRVMHMHHSVPDRLWRRTDHYNGIARPMGWNDQLMILAQNRGTLVAVGMYRAGIFTDDERELTLLLQPHLKAAWTRIQRIQPMERQPTPLRIELGANLQPLALTSGQCGVLHTYFPDWRASATLPDDLHLWLVASRRQMAAVPPLAPLRALVVKAERGRLLGRYFPHRDGGGASLVLVEEWRGRRITGAALSQREQEIMAWVARGKRDAEIARILNIATSTVSKHLENILRKAGARSRTEAVRLLQVMLSP